MKHTSSEGLPLPASALPHSFRSNSCVRKKKKKKRFLLLVRGVGLEVVVGTVGEGTANEENGVQADTEAGRVAALGARLGRGAGGLGLRGRVTGLVETSSVYTCIGGGKSPESVQGCRDQGY